MIDAAQIEEAIRALEGTVLEDLQLPLAGNLMDIAKAAALVSGVVEDRIPEMLNRVRATTWDSDQAHSLGGYEFRKSPIGFPDVLLVERANAENVAFEIEAKSWYILSSDPLTARFETAESVINEGTLVAIAAWMLDGVVSGSPKIVRIYIDDARRLAQERDKRWNATGKDLEGEAREIAWPGKATGPWKDHRVVQPVNPPGTPRNLLSTQVRGEVFKDGRWVKDAENFGKLDRLYDPLLAKFRDEVWSLQVAGKTLDAWRAFIKDSEITLDDSDLEVAHLSALQAINTAASGVSNDLTDLRVLIKAALDLGLDPKEIAKVSKPAGITKRAIEKIRDDA